MSAAVETEQLTKNYGKNPGIGHMDLAVEEGEVFGFLGPNGAGKTTTIRTLLGFLRLSGGRAPAATPHQMGRPRLKGECYAA